MTAESIAKALGGRKAGSAWMTRCPAHGDREPSLSIRDAEDGKVLVHCHAGCGQKQVIAALKTRGIWKEIGRRGGELIHLQPSLKDERDGGDARRTVAALRVWRATVPADGSLVETYLNSRGIVIPVPITVRFHTGIKHPRGQHWPALVALVTRGSDDAPVAVHRTFLARDGAGKAPVEPSKMMLGPCRGGAVRLAMPGDVLMVGEGIETCLAAMQATGHAAWAALSTSGLRALDLPADMRNVIVLADGDEPGEAAACDRAWRWKREGRRVRIARPPQGMDFNDMLLGRAPRVEEGAQ
jgi:hypothetical protein